MTDLFNEVDEQLRSDRLRVAAIKAAPWVTALAVILILGGLGVMGWRHYQANQIAKASETYAAGLDDMGAGRKAEAERKWAEIAKSGPKAYRSLALMQQAGLRMADNKTAEAVKLLDEAAKAAPDPVVADAARLKSAFAVLDSSPYKDVEARLLPLTEEGRPYRVEAREAIAFAKLVKGDTAGARSDFVVISLLPDASDAARRRADAAKSLIESGSAKAVPAAVKAAVALPPAPVPSPAPAGAQPPAPGSK